MEKENLIDKIAGKLDNKFISPKTLWSQDKNGKWYGKEGVINFIKQILQKEIKKIAEDVIGEINKLDEYFLDSIGFDKIEKFKPNIRKEDVLKILNSKIR